MLRSLIFVLLLACFLPLDVLAQGEDPPIATSQNVVRKNEIGTNYASWLIYGLRGVPAFPEVSLTYKRVVETRFKTIAIRAGFLSYLDIDPNEPS